MVLGLFVFAVVMVCVVGDCGLFIVVGSTGSSLVVGVVCW